MKFIPFSSDLIDQWVIFKDSSQFLNDHFKEMGLKDSKLNAGLGFVYADHSAGITLGIEYAAELGKKNEILNKISIAEATNSRLVFRADVCEAFEFHPIAVSALSQLDLPLEPEWVVHYETLPDWRWMRKEKIFDSFRAPFYPYDVQFSMGGEGFKTEGVWGRFLQRMHQEDLFALELLVEPHQDFGVHLGDILPVLHTQNEGEDMLVWMPHFGQLERAE